MAGWWNEQVVPRVVELTCGGDLADQWRRRACEPAIGTVVEFGFGSGHNLAHYGPRVQQVLAVEPSDVAWRRAAPRIERFARPVERISLDAAHLALPDDSVDTVVSTWTLCTIDRVDQALAEAARVLRPEGSLHLVEHSLSPHPRMARRQFRMQPWWGRVSGGCHVDRDILELVTSAGFALGQVVEQQVKPTTPFTWFVAASATPQRIRRVQP